MRARRCSRRWRVSRSRSARASRSPVSLARAASCSVSAAWRRWMGSVTASVAANSSSASVAMVAPVPSRRSSTEDQARSRSENPGSDARSRARSSRPPAAAAAWSASAASMPSSRRAWARIEAGMGPKSTRTQRLAMVTRSGGRWSASTTKTVVAGGSSIVLRRAGAASSTRWKSASTRILRAPSTGLSDARRTTLLASSTLMDAPVRSTRTTSACEPARARRQSSHSPQPPRGHRSRAAKPRAAVRLPVPGGPTNR